MPTTVSGAMENYGESLKQAFPGMLNKAGTWFVAAATSTGSILSGILNVVLIPVFTFYFLADFQIIVSFFENLIPDHRRERTVAALSRVDAAVGNWLRGQIEVAIVLSLLYGTGLAIVFGIFGLGAKTDLPSERLPVFSTSSLTSESALALSFLLRSLYSNGRE